MHTEPPYRPGPPTLPSVTKNCEFYICKVTPNDALLVVSHPLPFFTMIYTQKAYHFNKSKELQSVVEPSPQPKITHLFSCLPEEPHPRLSLFSDTHRTYHPSVGWLDGRIPDCPLFEESSRIYEIVTAIKRRLLDYALEGCKEILTSHLREGNSADNLLHDSINARPDLWKAVLSTQHYGVVYLISRSDAREIYLPLIKAHSNETQAIDEFLRANAAGIRAMNYAVHAYITRDGLQVDYATSFVPPNAISSVGERHVVIRAVDFARSSESMLAETNPLWDLHDFAHLSCATLCPPLYGNKYQTHLALLQKSLTALVRSPGMNTGTGPKISDGMIFSQLLTPMFTDALEQNKYYTYESLTERLATDLSEYLLGRRALKHLSTGNMITLSEPITPTQLAVLVQNKNYEHPASEIEQRVFARGGPAGSPDDVLLPMSARERIEYLAASKSWMYFEVRNTIKHRAHKAAYKIVCTQLIQEAEQDAEAEKEFLRAIMSNLMFEDWRAGGQVNLWSLLI
jgi:hypothetical protein